MGFIKDLLSDGFDKEFKQAFIKYSGDLTHKAEEWLKDKWAADQLVSDLWAKFWERRSKGRLRNDQLNYPYLLVSLRNACFGYLKRERRGLDIVPFDPVDGEDIAEPEDDTEKKAIVYREVEGWMSELSARQATVLHKRIFEEMEFSAIAEELGLSERTVRTHYWKAVNRLKKRSKKEGWGGRALMALMWVILGA